MDAERTLPDRAVAAAAEFGLDWAGIAGVAPPPHLARFPEWMSEGRAGEMTYLARRADDGRYLREDIAAAWPWARAVLCAAVVYRPVLSGPDQAKAAGASRQSKALISKYALGDDYHTVLRPRLTAWAERVNQLAGRPTARFAVTVDTAPLVERVAAAQAGLGWQGKNTCLIHPRRGSFFFIGVVLTEIELAPGTPLPDRCGSCTRCIDACPTEALTPYAMDARRCLAYLNIELRGAIPEEFRVPMGANVFGCDICQDVCPWNRRAPATTDPAFQPREGLAAPDLAALAALDEDAWRALFRNSAVKRAKFPAFRRNLAVAMGNSGDPAYVHLLTRWAHNSDDATLAEHARWALDRLESHHHS